MTKSRTILKSPLFWIGLLTAGYLLILALRPSEHWFGVPGQWTWGGRPPSSATYPRWWPAILCLGAGVIWGWMLDKRWETLSRRRRAGALLLLAGWIPCLQIALTHIHDPYPLAHYLHRTIGPHNGFWQSAIAIQNPLDYLRTYPDQMRTAGQNYVHLGTHPPGDMLYLWLWQQLAGWLPGTAHAVAHALRGYACGEFSFVTLQDAQIAATLGQMALVPLSGLTLLPLYAWGKQLGGARSGWRAAVLFSLVPALGLFTMRWDSVYPFFTATAFATLHRGLTTRRARWWYLAGLTVSLASFCSFGNATLAPAIALYAVVYTWQQSESLRTTWRALINDWSRWLALIGGGITVWGIFTLVSGVGLPTLLDISMGAHLYLGRSYGLWLAYNLYDLLAFVGVPSGALFCLAAVQSWRGALHRQRDLRLLPALSLSLFILVLDLTGVVRGETARLWMLWMPGLAVSAAVLLDQMNVKVWGFTAVAGLLALQTLWMALFLRVSSTGMPAYIPRTPEVPTAPGHPLDVTFAGDLRLLGYDIEPAPAAPGDTLDVTLYWQSGTQPDLPYTVFVHLSDAQGTLVAQHDCMPAGNQLPTTCWYAGETVRDLHPIPLPETLPTGEYTLHVGWYFLPTLERLPISGEADDRAELPAKIVVK